jgi:hypothetical protein
MMPYILGFTISAIIVSTIGLACSLCAWQAKGCIEWGLLLIAFGVAAKVMIEKL